MLHKVSSRRQIRVEMDFRHEGDTVHLAATDEDGNRAELILNMPYEEPRDPSMAREQVEKHLSSTGNTPFKVIKIRHLPPHRFFLHKLFKQHQTECPGGTREDQV